MWYCDGSFKVVLVALYISSLYSSNVLASLRYSGFNQYFGSSNYFETFSVVKTL